MVQLTSRAARSVIGGLVRWLRRRTGWLLRSRLLDRSVHTLLAHRYALERVTGLPCYQAAARTLAGLDIPTWPDLVIYLDVPQKIVLDRNKGKFADTSILINPVFNASIRDYFAQLEQQGGTRVAWLDATADVQQSLDHATSHIMRLLPGHHG